MFPFSALFSAENHLRVSGNNREKRLVSFSFPHIFNLRLLCIYTKLKLKAMYFDCMWWFFHFVTIVTSHAYFCQAQKRRPACRYFRCFRQDNRRRGISSVRQLRVYKLGKKIKTHFQEHTLSKQGDCYIELFKMSTTKQTTVNNLIQLQGKAKIKVIFTMSCC